MIHKNNINLFISLIFTSIVVFFTTISNPHAKNTEEDTIQQRTQKIIKFLQEESLKNTSRHDVLLIMQLEAMRTPEFKLLRKCDKEMSDILDRMYTEGCYDDKNQFSSDDAHCKELNKLFKQAVKNYDQALLDFESTPESLAKELLGYDTAIEHDRKFKERAKIDLEEFLEYERKQWGKK